MRIGLVLTLAAALVGCAASPAKPEAEPQARVRSLCRNGQLVGIWVGTTGAGQWSFELDADDIAEACPQAPVNRSGT